jgi:hypothetical protein
MKRVHECAKIDVALAPVALNNTNTTGKYLGASGYGAMLFILTLATMASTTTAILALFEATDAAGSGAQAITNASATITANTLVTKATVALASVGTGDTVTINGITFTKGSTVAASRTFADAAGLVLCIAHATAGVPGVTGTASSTNVILTATDPGAVALTVTSTDVGGTVTVATNEALAFVELNTDMLSAGFTHVAPKVTDTSNSVVAVTVLRGHGRFSPVQKVGASAVV